MIPVLGDERIGDLYIVTYFFSKEITLMVALCGALVVSIFIMQTICLFLLTIF